MALLNGWHPSVFPDRANLSTAPRGGTARKNPTGGLITDPQPAAQGVPCSIQPLRLELVAKLMEVQVKASLVVVFPSDPGLAARDWIDEVGGQSRRIVVTGVELFATSPSNWAWTVYGDTRT